MTSKAQMLELVGRSFLGHRPGFQGINPWLQREPMTASICGWHCMFMISTNALTGNGKSGSIAIFSHFGSADHRQHFIGHSAPFLDAHRLATDEFSRSPLSLFIHSGSNEVPFKVHKMFLSRKESRHYQPKTRIFHCSKKDAYPGFNRLRTSF